MRTVSAPNWPPRYLVRYSKKTKHVHLSIDPKKGLTVVLPNKAQHVDILQLIQRKKKWLERHLPFSTSPFPASLPEMLCLRSIEQTWTLRIQQEDSRKNTCLVHIKPFQLLLRGSNTLSTDQKVDKIKSWLKEKAYEIFIIWLRQLSFKHQLPFNQLQVRGQKTLWGSCTNKKNINLNFKLLFLPKNLVIHIMLHELTHTKYLNHGIRFKQLLKKIDPNTPEHELALKTADQYIPECFK